VIDNTVEDDALAASEKCFRGSVIYAVDEAAGGV
jgi:hypothetical protein